MPFRMNPILRFWVEVECEHQDLQRATDRELAAILQEFEDCGDAMRSLDRNDQIIWKPTLQMLERLADQEAEAKAEFGDDEK
jgi:hypothetical protein